VIKLSVQETIYDGIIQAMVNNRPWAAPRGTFYATEGIVVPYSPKQTVLRVETDRLNEPLEVEVIHQSANEVGVDPRKAQRNLTIVPRSTVVTFGVQLGRGVNKIRISAVNDLNDSDFMIVRASSIVSWFEAFARVLYSDAQRILEEQDRAVNSDLATRLFEPLIPFQDLLPDVQALQILAARLAARGVIHSVGKNDGVTDLTKALSLSTPFYRPMDKDTFDLEPTLDPWAKTGSQFGGKEAHVWMPNLGIASWLAFLGYVAGQPDLFEIVSVREDQIAVRYQGELQRHKFDFDAFGTDYLNSLSRSECFKSIQVSVSVASEAIVAICAAAYTFDLVIDEEHQIGNSRRYFDDGVPLDSGLTYDSDQEDPFSEGWVGLSLTGRFEQDALSSHCLDTFVMPSALYPGADCCYPTFYSQLIRNEKAEYEATVSTSTSGFYEIATRWVIQSPNSSFWYVKVLNNGTLITESGAPAAPNHFRVTKPDTSEASFAITNAGVLQVIAPADAGAVNLNNSLFLMSPDSHIWEVTVNNSNQLVTNLVF
jgi:hypothetical protein